MLKKILITTGCLCLSFSINKEEYTKKQITSYAKSLGINETQLYYIKPELQEKYYAIGQPNSIVYNKIGQRLKAGTCYEEFPYYMDTFREFKSQVKDTLSMYTIRPDKTLKQILSETIDTQNEIAIDKTKKYYHVFYFAKYASSMDKKKLKAGIKKYSDSIQYFFVSVDKIKD